MNLKVSPTSQFDKGGYNRECKEDVVAVKENVVALSFP